MDVIQNPGMPPDRNRLGAPSNVTDLFRQHHPELVRLALLVVGDLATAEDVVQDAFEQLHRRWHLLRRRDSALDYARSTVLNSSQMSATVIAGIHEFAVSPANAIVRTGQVVRFPRPVSGFTSALVTGDGQDVIGSSCLVTGQETATARIDEVSAADGRLIAVLGTQTLESQDAKSAVAFMCSVLSVGSTGKDVLIEAFGFGRLDSGVFTWLPGPGMTPGSRVQDAAW